MSIGKTDLETTAEQDDISEKDSLSKWNGINDASTATASSNHDAASSSSSWGQNSISAITTTFTSEPYASSTRIATSTIAAAIQLEYEVINGEDGSQGGSEFDATEVQEEPDTKYEDHSKLPCSELPGAGDVVFIIKTGATEVEEKLPVHVNTTLRCYPHSLIFSDFGETFQGHTIC